MAEDIFYVVELALPDVHLAAFAEWYAGVHAPHLFQAGFTNCTSYMAVSGGLSVVDVYQAPDWSMFTAPAFERYRGIAAADPYRPLVLAEVTNPRTVYLHHAASSLPLGATQAPMDADWLMIWRLAGDAATEARIAAWLAAEGQAALRGLGVQGIRLLHRGRDAPTGTSFRPPLALVTEWPARPPEAKALALLPAWLRDAMAQEGFAGLRIYPWPLDRAAKAEMRRGIIRAASS